MLELLLNLQLILIIEVHQTMTLISLIFLRDQNKPVFELTGVMTLQTIKSQAPLPLHTISKDTDIPSKTFMCNDLLMQQDTS